MSALTLDLAHARVRVEGMTPAQRHQLLQRFGDFESSTGSCDALDMLIETTQDPRNFMVRPRGTREYRLSVRYEPHSIRVEGVGFSADLSRDTLHTRMVTCREDDWFLDGFENLSRVVVSYQSFRAGALVLHSAAFTDGTRGFVCCGRSGAGKTTLCGLASQLGLRVLSDELNLVALSGPRLEVEAMPFAGDFGRIAPPRQGVPLTALLGLRQGPEPRLEGCSPAEAVSRIVASCPYVNADPELGHAVSDRAATLVDRLPLRILSFDRNTTFWNTLDDEYPRA
ncbi:MAG: hypothetical protein AAF500_16790 [Myxococcota bacterium]